MEREHDHPSPQSRPLTDIPRNVPSIFSSNQRPSSSSACSPSRSSTQPRPPPMTTTGSTSPSSTTTVRHRSTSFCLPTAAPEGGIRSPEANDRVFPIRSYVSVDPNSTTSTAASSTVGSRNEYFPSDIAHRLSNRRSSGAGENRGALADDTRASTDVPPTPNEGTTSRKTSASTTGDGAAAFGRYNHRRTDTSGPINLGADDTASTRTESIRGAASSVGRAPSEMSVSRDAGDEIGPLITARFKHVVTDGGHCVITGRDGETLQRCEDEPIHIPGAIQSFGALVALMEEGDGKLVVRVVSENSKRVLGYSPKQLFALESFTDILSEENSDNLLDHIDFIRDEGADVETDGPEVFTLSIRNAKRRPQKLWSAIHINARNKDLIICEFELEDDLEYPLVPLNDETPEPPEDTLASDPTADEFKESTESISKPLRVLRSARKRKGEAAAMEVFNIMSQVQEQLAVAPTLQAFLKILVGVVKELTGFHRVMVYQFDQAWNGSVVTELVDPRATKDLYKGLHFPASDIPKQARDMYKVNKVRLLYDRDQDTARLVCRTQEDLDKPLDLTHSYLRAMSPIHIKYLKNMAVRSSMSISINAFDELWGLISCHAYGNRGTRVSFPIRKMCRLIGDSASRNIERISYASRLQARKLINTAPTKSNPSGYIIASSDDLLRLFNADFGLLSIHDETKILGKIEGTQEALAMLEYLRMRRFASVTMTQDIRLDFPDLRYPPGFQVIAGLLLVPLTAGGYDFIVFFRKGQLREVKWAGNPYEKYVKEGTEGYLEPRKSFKAWSEKIVGKCREWTEEEVETAAVLCLVYGKFIEVWRQKEAALQNTQLTKLLLANSAHEVRTPLNAIINYLEIAMEGSLDQETRDNLSRSHSASKSLIYVINDLLDLTKTEASAQLVHDEVFDLLLAFREGVEMFQGDARRKNISFDVKEHPGVPSKVIGDQRRVRQAISNVVANAVQATTEGGIKIDISVSATIDDHHADVEISVEDTGTGMSNEKLDALFAELEQAQSETDKMIEETIAPQAKTLTYGKDSKKALGLGLAIVARIIRNMNGQLRVRSEAGKGSRFSMQFPFDLPNPLPQGLVLEPPKEAEEPVVNDDSSSFKELTLVERPAGERRGSHDSNAHRSRRSSADSALSRKSLGSLKSTKSMASGKSGKSFASNTSQKSEADRLIEAMQEPHMVQRNVSSYSDTGVSRSSSSQSTITDSKRHAGRDSTSPALRRLRSHDGSSPVSQSRPELPSSRPVTSGELEIQGSIAPLRAIRVPSEEIDVDEAQRTGIQFQDMQSGGAPTSTPATAKEESKPPPAKVVPPAAPKKTRIDTLRVLVAEDDPINSKIVQKRLQKLGHDTHLCVNGEECAAVFGERPGDFDVVLMDMQMPIVDGMTSTKMIRSYEKSNPERPLSTCAGAAGRIPIIAVSASLVEKERSSYQEAGFDAWILKPINFNRLNDLMKASTDEKLRNEVLYSNHKNWESGGWFHADHASAEDSDTKPSERVPYTDDKEQREEAKIEGAKGVEAEVGAPSESERAEAQAEMRASEPALTAQADSAPESQA